MILDVIEVTPAPGSTVWVGVGVTPFGRTVKFAGDWRPMRDLAQDLAGREEPLQAEVESWAILGEV